MMAMERGETQGRCGMTWSAFKSTMPEWVRDRKIYVALQFAIEKHPELPDVPMVTELARNAKEKHALELILAGQAMGRPFVAPPGLAPVRLATLRRAFDATMKDAAFVAEAERLKLTVEPIGGEEIARVLSEIYATSPDVVRRVSRILGHVSGPAAP